MNTNAVNPIYPIYPITRVLHNHGFCHLSGRGQSGGGRIRLFTYRDVVFQVTRTYEDDRVNLFFASVDGGETSDCGYIIIAKSEERNKAIVGTEQAIVGTKQKTPSYLHDLTKMTVSWKMILNAIIEYVRRRVQAKYNIEYIQLRDNSSIYIHPNGDLEKRPVRVFLADYYTLTRGTTYYSQFGFVPFHVDTNRPDKNVLKAFLKNVKIMQTARLKDSKTLSRHVKNSNPDSPSVGVVAKSLFLSNPELMNSIVEDVCDDLGLHRFVGSSWYIQL